MPEQKSAAPAVHPLLSREIRPLYNWHEWLARWDAALTAEELLGLLHVGFNVPLDRSEHGEKGYDAVDRVLFYFAIADGWADSDLLELPTDRKNFGGDAFARVKRRQELACKAFDMLCLNFFTEVVDYNYGDPAFKEDWGENIISGRFFSVVQRFFKAEEPRPYSFARRIRNLSLRQEKQSHNEERAVNFILALTGFVWQWREQHKDWDYVAEGKEKERGKREEKEYNTATRSRIDSAKPWLIEVLTHLDKLDGLWKLRDHRELLLTLDESCLAKLAEIALRSELVKGRHPVTEGRPVATVNEACLVGSRAAWFLKKYELMHAEHRRLTAILKAEQAKASADRKLQTLKTEEQR